VHVALVGRGNVERERAEQGVPGGLEDRRPSGHRQAVTTQLASDVRSEHARVARRGLQLATALVADLVDDSRHLVLDGEDDVGDERRGASGEVGDGLVLVEGDGHRSGHQDVDTDDTGQSFTGARTAHRTGSKWAMSRI
jgi:hypothetical protein